MGQFVLGIIPARAGSKGIKNKNLKLLAGKPLIQYTIEAALNSGVLSDTIVSTDSEEIAQLSIKLGAHVPFMRPEKYATDTAATLEVVIHAIEQYERMVQQKIDIVMILQPTAPLRRSEDVSEALYLFKKNEDYQTLISCYEANHMHPNIMYKKDGDCLQSFLCDSKTVLRRQEFDSFYIRNGAVYIAKRDVIMIGKRIIDDQPMGYIMPRERSINIDDQFDFDLAEMLLKYYYK